MIQFKRGLTKTWKASKVVLADGQPGYDKNKHKIKIGDGKSTWDNLPYASGLSAEDIISSEQDAKIRAQADPSDKVVITYGTSAPDKTTVGQLYLQQSKADHIVEAGILDGWVYQIHSSGIMNCYGAFKATLDVIDNIEGTGLYCDSSNFKKNYPKAFKNPPIETVSVQSAQGLAWLANKSTNTVNSSGVYTVVSPATANNVEYTISIQAVGIKK